jgi:hypothetical protein
MRFASLCALALAAASAGSTAAGLSRPAAPPRFKGHRGPVALTFVRLVRAEQVGALVSACVPGDRIPSRRVVVERSGSRGSSMTFLGLWGAVDACDRAPGSHPRPWCGRASWPLRHHRVSDPRVTVCVDEQGRPLAAFAWIDPLPGASWIVVDQPRAAEAYPVVAGLPVRVETVTEIGRGRATFAYEEFDAKGVMLARSTITPAIAG